MIIVWRGAPPKARLSFLAQSADCFALGHRADGAYIRAHLAPKKPYQRFSLRVARPILVGYTVSLCSNPIVYTKKRHRKGGVWCTRWGSNPDSTASEAVMLSNYTTSTKEEFSVFQKRIYILLFFAFFLQAFML